MDFFRLISFPSIVVISKSGAFSLLSFTSASEEDRVEYTIR